MENKRSFTGQVRRFDRKKAEETRTIEFIASTDKRDRHGTVVNQKGWKLENYRKNPIIGYQHDVYGENFMTGNDPDNVIGTGRVWLENNMLIVAITFEEKENNQLAEKVFRKVLSGVLKAVSVGFNEIGIGRWGEGDESPRGANPTYYFEGQELLEISVVNIPSNPDAVVRKSAHSKQAVQFLTKLQEATGLTPKQLMNLKLNEIEVQIARHEKKRLAVAEKYKEEFARLDEEPEMIQERIAPWRKLSPLLTPEARRRIFMNWTRN